jgi:hypothetical protein
MRYIAIGFCGSALLSLVVAATASTPAAAISADLAIKCRNMAVKAYPPKRIGSKSGNAAAERKYYQSCITNNGEGPAEDKQSPEPQPPSK